jgi:hypothetical protein
VDSHGNCGSRSPYRSAYRKKSKKAKKKEKTLIQRTTGLHYSPNKRAGAIRRWRFRQPPQTGQTMAQNNLNLEKVDVMKKLYTILFTLTLTLGLIADLSAQTPTPTPGKRTPRATRRQGNQQERIGQGVASGELTAGETRKLEKEQKEIQKDKVAARADGTVTGAERKEIQKDQNKASRHIYRAKHNNKTRK